MLGADTAAIIAGASAIGGGLIVAVSNYAISRVQARDAEREELARVLVELYYALSRVDQRLRLEPKPGRAVRAINDTLDTRLPFFHYTIGRIRRRLLEPDLDELLVALLKALSAATLTAPKELLAVIGTLAELMSELATPEGDWLTRWNEARSDYFVQSRRALSADGRRAMAMRTSRR